MLDEKLLLNQLLSHWELEKTWMIREHCSILQSLDLMASQIKLQRSQQ